MADVKNYGKTDGLSCALVIILSDMWNPNFWNFG